MLFRTRRVKKKYFKLKKEYSAISLQKSQRNRLRNWHIYHRLKKLKHNYAYRNCLTLSDSNKKFFFGKINYIQKTFKEAASLSSEYRLIFQNFIKHKLIFNNYESYYKKGSSTLFFSFFIVKSKMQALIHIFYYFKNYFIINFETDYCYLIYVLSGGLDEFLLFYLLYLRYVFASIHFEDIIFSDLNYEDFWSLLFEKYFILNQFYCSMLKYDNIHSLSSLCKTISNLEVFDERTISEKSKDEIEDTKLFENFELEENENMLLNDYILYNNNDYLNLLNENLSNLCEVNFCPFLISDNENYLKFSLTILNNIDVLFLDNLESVEN